ncbi:MAG: hypothetical protein WC091_03470 [Sulfuricellaceae bacterium]
MTGFFADIWIGLSSIVARRVEIRSGAIIPNVTANKEYDETT